jgi:hypothetical protein
MTEDDTKAAIDDVEFALKAIEPWIAQLLKWNPDEKYLGPIRRETAEKLIELAQGIASR